MRKILRSIKEQICIALYKEHKWSTPEYMGELTVDAPEYWSICTRCRVTILMDSEARKKLLKKYYDNGL